MSDSDVMGSPGSDDETSTPNAASETLDAGSGEGVNAGAEPRPRVQRRPKADETSVHEQVFEKAKKSAQRGVAEVKQAVSDAEPGSILLSTTLIAVGSAAVGAMIGWTLARR